MDAIKSRTKQELLKVFNALADDDLKRAMDKASAEQRTLIGFILKHDLERIDGFWWCGGSSWSTRDYRVVLLAVKDEGRGRRLCAAAEWSADTPAALGKALQAICDPPENIAELCESAGRSPRRRKRP